MRYCGERVGRRNDGFNAALTSLIATDLFAVKASNRIQRKEQFTRILKYVISQFLFTVFTVILAGLETQITCWPEATFYFDLASKELTTIIIYLFNIIGLLKP